MDPAIIAALKELIKNGDTDAAMTLLESMGAPAAAPDSALAEGADPPKPDDPNAAPAAAKTPAAAAPAAKVPDAAATAIDPAALRTAVETALTAMVPGAKTFDQAKAAISGTVSGRSAEELAERQSLIAELVALGVETPATAWDGDATKQVPVARLASEPIASFRTRVATMKASRPAAATRIVAPVVADGDLTESERARVAKMKPEQKARFLELRASRRSAPVT